MSAAVTGIDFWLAVTIMLGVAAGIPLGMASDRLWKAVADAILWKVRQ